MSLGWVAPAGAAEQFTDAVNAAKGANAAVVVVDSDSSEGSDRTTLALPGDQDALIAAVAAANPRTIVRAAGRRAGAHAVAVAGAGRARHLVSRPGGRQRAGRAAVRRRRPVGPAAGHLPAQRHADAGHAPPRYPAVDGNYDYTEGLAGRLPLVRRAERGPAVPVRVRPVVHALPLSTTCASAAAATTRRPCRST